LLFQIWDKKSASIVAEEAEPHQAAMVTNQGKPSRDGKPRNNTGSGKTPEMKFVPHGIGKDRQTVTYQTVKD
jgi:hypothetical protein